jgi:hypothetical protein
MFNSCLYSLPEGKHGKKVEELGKTYEKYGGKAMGLDGTTYEKGIVYALSAPLEEIRMFLMVQKQLFPADFPNKTNPLNVSLYPRYLNLDIPIVAPLKRVQPLQIFP